MLNLRHGMLVCFVDESGDEGLSDANHPVFGLGGCAAMAHAMAMHLDLPWRRMKARHFGGEHGPLHAAGLRPTAAQTNAIATFFRRRAFMRFAAFLSRDTTMVSDIERLAVLAPALMRRIGEVASTVLPRPTALALVFEESQRLASGIQRHFDGLTLSDEVGRPIPAKDCFAPKSATLPGLEVADFVMHAAAGQVRSRVRGRPGWRRDYQAVFHSAAGARSFIDIESVAQNFVDEEERRLQGGTDVAEYRARRRVTP
jgi:hypothetical protein